MNDIEVDNIKNALFLAQFYWDKKENVVIDTPWDEESLTIKHVYNEEYLRWIKVYQILFNLAM